MNFFLTEFVLLWTIFLCGYVCQEESIPTNYYDMIPSKKN